jgi:hypothetical protein
VPDSTRLRLLHADTSKGRVNEGQVEKRGLVFKDRRHAIVFPTPQSD